MNRFKGYRSPLLARAGFAASAGLMVPVTPYPFDTSVAVLCGFLWGWFAFGESKADAARRPD